MLETLHWHGAKQKKVICKQILSSFLFILSFFLPSPLNFLLASFPLHFLSSSLNLTDVITRFSSLSVPPFLLCPSLHVIIPVHMFRFNFSLLNLLSLHLLLSGFSPPFTKISFSFSPLPSSFHFLILPLLNLSHSNSPRPSSSPLYNSSSFHK